MSAGSGRTGGHRSMETTRVKRTTYLGTLVSVVTEVLLPLLTSLLPLGKVIDLFREGHFSCGVVGVFLFLLPTFLILFFYLENFLHRKKRVLELGLITVLGPFLRWAASVRLFLVRQGKAGHVMELDDLEIFISAIKMIDGIFQPAVQIIFMLYLFAVGVNNPQALFSGNIFETTKISDFNNNVVDIPTFSSLNLYTSVAALVKNISQLWMANFPRGTTESGSEAVATPATKSAWRKILQWMVLVVFVMTVVTYRLLTYLIIYLHFGFFYLPFISVILVSFASHILLRGLSDQFYVSSKKTDIFLTACCSILVPTPSSANIRAHNLLQAHTVLTNLVMFVCLGFCLFFNIDYYLPVISRGSLKYNHYTFFNASLMVIFLPPISLLLYLIFKKLMGQTGQRKTFFWTNGRPTWWGILAGTVSLVLLSVLLALTFLGWYSSGMCSPPPGSQAGDLAPSIGFSLQCNTSSNTVNLGKIITILTAQSLTLFPLVIVYCGWFFGPHGGLSEFNMTSLITAPIYNSTISWRIENSTFQFEVDFEPQGINSVQSDLPLKSNASLVNASRPIKFNKTQTENTRVVFDYQDKTVKIGFVNSLTNCTDCNCIAPQSLTTMSPQSLTTMFPQSLTIMSPQSLTTMSPQSLTTVSEMTSTPTVPPTTRKTPKPPLSEMTKTERN